MSDHGHQHGDHTDEPSRFWHDFYDGDQHHWSGEPNRVLVDELTARPATGETVLDLGCGEGADTVWLARQGWTATGLDIAEPALARARGLAETAGVGVRTRWLQADLAAGFPQGSWDLVVAAYFHSPVELPRGEVLRRAADAVAPGGTLLVIGHQTAPSSQAPPEGVPSFPTADDVVAELDLDGWTVERAEEVAVPATAPDGAPDQRTDSVVRLRRPTGQGTT